MTVPAVAPSSVVVTDANILINLFHIGRLALLGELPPLRFMVPQEVVNEITRPEQRSAVEEAIRSGWIVVTSLTALPAVQLFATLTGVMGRGEAACLSLAHTDGHMIASDERKKFRREAERLIGQARIMTTADILVAGIRAGRLTVADADVAKAVLAQNRFQLPFASFADVL